MSRVAPQPWRRRLALLGEALATISLRTRIGLITAYVVSAASSALLPLGLKWVIDGVTTGDRDLALRGVALSAVGAAGSDGAGRAGKDLMLYFTRAGGHVMIARTLRKVATLPSLEHLERADVQDQVSIVTAQGAAIPAAIITALQSMRTVVQLTSSMVLLLSVDPLLLLFPAFVVPSIVLVPKVNAARQRAVERAAELERRSAHLDALFTDVDAAQEMRVFGAGHALDDAAHELYDQAVATRLAGELRAARLSALGAAALALGYVASLVVVLASARGDVRAAGSALMVIQLAGNLRWQLQGSIGLAQQVRGAVETLDRAIWLDDFVPQGYGDAAVELPPETLTTGLRLEAVTFRYPGTETDVLHDIDLTLPAGSTVAVVGDNGAGKTTFVKLLCGFYRPTSGRIVVDGVDLATVDPAAWHSRTSAAFQDHLKLETSLRESIAPPNERRHRSDEDILDAARRGDATSFTSHWLDGLDTHLGKLYRDGEQLSGGQWQRVAVARAMLPDAPLLLVLDEPTAALDPAAEHRLYRHYTEAARAARERTGCVTVLISHRFSTVRMADRIVVLDGGTVVEHGTHPELMAAGGEYARMFRRQADAYA